MICYAVFQKGENHIFFYHSVSPSFQYFFSEKYCSCHSYMFRREEMVTIVIIYRPHYFCIENTDQLSRDIVTEAEMKVH